MIALSKYGISTQDNVLKHLKVMKVTKKRIKIIIFIDKKFVNEIQNRSRDFCCH